MITVAKDGTGDYESISEALASVDTTPATIYIKNGTYNERVSVLQSNITLIGEDVENTIISMGYHASMPHTDGSRLGTFRTYTFLANADNITVKNISFVNSSGFGSDVDQAIAVYNEGDNIYFENCKMLGHQDTLFTGPLPPKEIQPGGFIGPTQNALRKNGRHTYKNCYIEGDVDFIFGSATAYFDNCTIHSLSKNMNINGYVVAPSTPKGQTYGYVFNNCTFTSNCPDNTVYLGRPWRNFAKTVLLNCHLGAHIHAEGFHDWNKTEARETVFFAEYNSKGPGANNNNRASFVNILSSDDAHKYTYENVMNSI